MASLYDSGMGGDMNDSYYGGMGSEDERRRRLAGQADSAPSQGAVPPKMQPAPQMGGAKGRGLGGAFHQMQQKQQARMAPRVAPAMAPQQTFAQMQQEGYARPNPPAPAPAPAPAPTRSAAPAGVQAYEGDMQDTRTASASPMEYTGAPVNSVAPPGAGGTPAATGQGLDIGAELANRYRQGSGISSEVSGGISEAIRNPSAYNSDLVRNIYGQLGQNIDDDFAQRETGLREEMAARGLSDSSIQGGRLRDLNVGRRSAREGLANSLGQQVAQDYSGARDRALGMGMNRDQYGQQVGQGYLDRLMGFGQQSFNNDMQQAEFNRNIQNDQDRFMLQMLGLGG